MSRKKWIIGLIIFFIPFIFVTATKSDTSITVEGEISEEGIGEIIAPEEVSGYTQNQKVIALMYHHILKESENQFKENGAVINLEAFKEQMEYLNSKGYNTITMKELEEFLYYKRPLPKSKNNISILVTFDDGYLSNYIYAYPIMKQCGFKGTIFSVTSYIPDESIHIINPNKLERISLEQMRRSRDVFDYESHGHHFHAKDRNNVPYLLSASKEEILEDLKKSKDKLGKTEYFCYPYGKYDEKVIEALKELDFKLAVTTEQGIITHETDPYQIPRFGIFPWTSLESFDKIFNF